MIKINFYLIAIEKNSISNSVFFLFWKRGWETLSERDGRKNQKNLIIDILDLFILSKS